MKNGLIAKKIFSKNAIRKVSDKILALGINAKIDINLYLNIKLIFLVMTFIFSLIFSEYGYLIAPLLTTIFYYGYDYLILDLKIKKRAKNLEHDAIFFFEVLALTLQSDHNLKVCLEITTEAIDSDLSSEFKEVLKEVKLGKSFTEALNDAKKRIPSKSVNNVLLNIIEANVYGTSIIGALENQIAYLMDKRILEIKGQINKMPTKISIISVLFFIPLIMLLILGPVLINYFF